jgi:hypothetical protein
MKPTIAWAAYRYKKLLYESIRGTRGEVIRYCNALFEVNKICTLDSLGIKIHKVTISLKEQ